MIGSNGSWCRAIQKWDWHIVDKMTPCQEDARRIYARDWWQIREWFPILISLLKISSKSTRVKIYTKVISCQTFRKSNTTGTNKIENSRTCIDLEIFTLSFKSTILRAAFWQYGNEYQALHKRTSLCPKAIKIQMINAYLRAELT